MAKLVRFRPSPEEEEILLNVMSRKGFAAQSEAVRFLIRHASEKVCRLHTDPFFRFRVSKRRAKRSISSREIDELLYGGR